MKTLQKHCVMKSLQKHEEKAKEIINSAMRDAEAVIANANTGGKNSTGKSGSRPTLRAERSSELILATVPVETGTVARIGIR